MYINSSCQIINNKLDEHLVDEEVEEIFQQCSPGTGSIDFTEFMNIMTEKTEKKEQNT